MRCAVLEESFEKVYNKLNFEFYRRVFTRVREREGSLSAMEAFSLEVIEHLGSPTIGLFADFIGISQSNATYKVNSLIKKGYLKKENSPTDRREYKLILSEKYYGYRSMMHEYMKTVMHRVEERFPKEDLETAERMLKVISEELMPETEI